MVRRQVVHALVSVVATVEMLMVATRMVTTVLAVLSVRVVALDYGGPQGNVLSMLTT